MGKIESDSEDICTVQGLLDQMQSKRKDRLQLSKHEKEIYYPSKELSKNAHVQSLAEYKKLYQESIKDPQMFWSKMSKNFYFHKYQQDGKSSFEFNFDIRKGPIYTKFLEGATTNVCYNCLDRHIENGFGDKIAFYWEGNEQGTDAKVTYIELHEKVCKFANALKYLGVQPGDVVAIYMPMALEIVVAMLACTRIGAVHSVVFAGYSAQALADRLVDGKVQVLITADGSWRGEKFMALKEICDDAMIKSEEQGHDVEHCIVLNHLSRGNARLNESGERTIHKTISYISPLKEGRDIWWDEICSEMPANCPPTWVDAEHPMFILYTSGSTGKPKGVVHTTAGYMIFAATNFKYSFDFHPETDVFWGTSDMGWCAAHTNILYGPLSNGGTSVLFEGTPFYPDITRVWRIIDKYQVTQFYTAPTVLRTLMKFGNDPVRRFKRDSLRVLGSVGEPINPQVWRWYFTVVGESRCPIVDTYGQTETGGHILTSLPGATPTKPGSAGLPFFGAVPVLLTKEGQVIEGPGEGCLVFSQPWPTIARAVHGDKKRYESNYFGKFPGYYCTGDAAKRDQDGFYSISGRVDDMLNVSGHLISTTRVESALLEHNAIAEVAVVPVPHEIKGQSLQAFVVLKEDYTYKHDKTVKELRDKVREKVGSFAAPDTIVVCPVLPMTRSGKILRRVLIKIAMKDNNFGDTSTLVDESVLNMLFDLVNKDKNNNEE